MSRPKIVLPSELSFSTELVVRVSDVNYAGHLSNDRVLSFVHEARTRFLAEYSFTELDVAGVGTIMTDAVIIYKAEAFYGDRIRIDVQPAGFHKFGCFFYYRLINAETGRETARAQTGMVFFDYESRKMLPVPPLFIERCAPPSERPD